MNNVLGVGYMSYDNFKEFGRMTAAMTALVERVRPELGRLFDQRELRALTDMYDYLRCVELTCDDGHNLFPIGKGGMRVDGPRRGSTVGEVCAATLKLAEHVLLGGSALEETVRGGVAELCAFCRWQWLNQAAEPEEAG